MIAKGAILFAALGALSGAGEREILPVPARGIRAGGWLAGRLERAAARMRALRDPERLLADLGPKARKGWHWGADYPGRWLEATAYLADAGLGDFDPEPILAGLLRHQEPDGHFGKQRDKMTYWGDHRGLVALATLAARGNRTALAAAEKLAGFYAVRASAGDWAAMGALDGTPGTPGCPIEGLVLLYRVGRDPRHLALAERIAARTMAALAHPRGHSHTILSSCRGLAELAEITGKRAYLEACRRVWDLVAREHAYISGQIPEGFPDTSGDETCSTADWIRLCFQLWRLTRDARYLDAAERAVFNGLPFEQLPNGGFVGHRNLAGRAGKEWDFCCTHHGSLALVHILENIYGLARRDGEDVVGVNLFIPSRAEIPLSGGGAVTLVLEGDYPAGEDVALRIEASRPAACALRLRVPPSARSEGLRDIRVNGVPIEATREGDFALIRPPAGAWRSGDRLTFRCPVPLRAERRPPGRSPGEEVAFRHGPLLLACAGVEATGAPCRLVSARQDYGRLEFDRSVHTKTPLRIGGKAYAHGLGAHANGTIEIALAEGVRSFRAEVGIDDNRDTAGRRGSAVFAVLADGKERFRSPVLRGGDAPVPAAVDLRGARRLTLRVEDAGDGIRYDQADWAAARLVLEDGREIVLSNVLPRGTAPPAIPPEIASHPSAHMRRVPAENDFGLAYRLATADGRAATLVPLAGADPSTPGFGVWFRVERKR